MNMEICPLKFYFTFFLESTYLDIRQISVSMNINEATNIINKEFLTSTREDTGYN